MNNPRMKPEGECIKTRFYYHLEARLPGEKWQHFTGLISSTKRKSIKVFVAHCKIHFVGMPYEYRMKERIIDTYDNLLTIEGKELKRKTAFTRFKRAVKL